MQRQPILKRYKIHSFERPFCLGYSLKLVILTKTEVRQNEADDDNQADDINDGVHDFLCRLWAGHCTGANYDYCAPDLM